MGPCVCCGKDMTTKTENIKLANKVFMSIDISRKGELNSKNLTQYFKEYTQTSVMIILDGVDLNQDGIITKSQWMAYWEYVRQAGYSNKAIFKSLSKIDKGIADLGFTGAANYQSNQPRETLIKGIQKQIEKDPAVLPFLLEPQ